MKQETHTQAGYSICTYRIRLYDRHFNWIVKTKALYEKVVQHFLTVLEQKSELLEQSDFNLLRILEILCIGTKEMKGQGILPEFPMNGFPKIPLYFRRSAINAAITGARSINMHKKNETDNFLNTERATCVHEETVERGSNVRVTNGVMTLYKGMYRKFTDKTIELKLFNGEKWVWVTYPFTGREFPKEAERLSPMLVIEKKNVYLNVPMKQTVSDIRTIKERMQQEIQICAVAFPDYDVMAAAVILSKDGQQKECQFFRGGKQKEYQKKRILEQIQTSIKSRGFHPNGQENTVLYSRLRQINQYYAHRISRQIVNYCLEKQIKILVLPNYEITIDFKEKQYMTTNNYRWLGRSIIQKLQYKAFQEGIVVTTVKPYHTSDTCHICGATIAKYNEGHVAGKKYYGGKLYVCPNGHKGNSAENAANNIGKQFLNYFN